MKLITKRKRLLGLIALAISTISIPSFSIAAEVPADVTLADKQEIVRNNGAEVTSLDPHKVEGIPESNVIRDLFEGLVNTDQNGEVIPGIAERWQNKGDKVWTFFLRKEAKWTNGDPVTAHDFVYSWQRLVDPNTASAYASYLQYAQVENAEEIIKGKKTVDMLGVKALDDHTLQVTLAQPVPYFIKMLFHTSLKPVPKKAIDTYGERWTQPANIVSNGAYQLKDWVINEHIILTRNSNYWDNDHTVINQVTYLPIVSEVTDVSRYRAGEIDLTSNQLPVELFKKLKTDLPNEIKTSPYLCTYYYELNNSKAPFDDVRVRKALNMTLDRELITNKVKGQGDVPAYSFTPPYTNGIGQLKLPKWTTWTMEKRQEEAKKLLAEAGYSKSNPAKFTLLYNTSDIHKKLAIAVASIWKKNLDGMVDITLENQEWKTFLDSRNLGKHQMARAGWCADYNEPSSFLNILSNYSSNNRSFNKTPELDQLLTQAQLAGSEQERITYYQQIETLIDDHAIIIPLFDYVSTRLVKPSVGGYSENNPLDEVYSKNLYIKAN